MRRAWDFWVPSHFLRYVEARQLRVQNLAVAAPDYSGIASMMAHTAVLHAVNDPVMR